MRMRGLANSFCFWAGKREKPNQSTHRMSGGSVNFKPGHR